MNTAAILHPFRIRCAGLEYIAMAASACLAIEAAIALHGVPAATAAPMRKQGGTA